MHHLNEVFPYFQTSSKESAIRLVKFQGQKRLIHDSKSLREIVDIQLALGLVMDAFESTKHVIPDNLSRK